MKKPLVTLLLIVSLAMVCLALMQGNMQNRGIIATVQPIDQIATAIPAKPSSKFLKLASEAKTFTRDQKFREDYFFLVDLGLPSGKKRFFIYDLQKDSIQNSGLVTHGNCNQYWLENVKFDNTVGGGCSSLGKYKIGYAYQGRFGLAYKMHGLDATNSNAFERYVVLHSHECVPDKEVDDEICQSNGCPTVSPAFLVELDNIIRQSKKPILLWIVD